MFQYQKDYLALCFHINLWIFRHLALITHDATYVVNSSMLWNEQFQMSAAY